MHQHHTEYSLATVDMPTICGIRTLTQEEYEIIFKEIVALENFHSEDALYDLVELNYQDLVARTDFYLNQYIADPKLDFSKFSAQFLDLNRLILNLLSSIRTYLDHTETRLKRTFGDKSDEYQLFKSLTSECFDTHFAYRFLAKLRNYSQHCGMPTGSISITNNEAGYSLKLSLTPDNLLKNFDSWGTIVKSELQTYSEDFDIIPLLQQKALLLKEVNQKVSEVLLKKLSRQGEHLLQLLVETLSKGNGIPTLVKVSGDIDNPNVNMKWFPYGVISTITGVKINVVYKGECAQP